MRRRHRLGQVALTIALWLLGGCSLRTTALPSDVDAIDSGGADGGRDASATDTGSDAPSCPVARTDCGGRCVDLESERTDCGACGNECTSDELCAAGACVTTCPSGLTSCAGGCRDFAADRDHCGGCGDACTLAEACVMGVCENTCGWTRQRTLTFDNSAQAEDLDDFTVLLRLNATRIDYAEVQDAGQDLRFTDADGATLLAYEIETWSESGASFVWVRVPRVDASSRTDSIVMYYGNAAASAGQRPDAAWDASYEAVWHLHAGMADSTTHGHDATNMGSTAIAGRVSRGRRFDGLSQHLVADTTVGSAPDLTFELWMRSRVDTGYHRPIEKLPSLGTQGWSVLQRPAVDTFPRGLIFRIGSENESYGGWGNEVSAPNVYAAATWVYVAGTYDLAARTGTLYIDGSMVDQKLNMDGRGVANTDTALKIGTANGYERFDGDIDEVRVSSSARSAAYVAAQYLSQLGSFVAFGDESMVGLTCPE